jgi:hypothetical protein
MSYNVKTLEIFERQARRLIKKYASLKSELSALIAQLKENPKTGTPIGSNCYKIHLAIASTGKGKSVGEGYYPYCFYRSNRLPFVCLR